MLRTSRTEFNYAKSSGITECCKGHPEYTISVVPRTYRMSEFNCAKASGTSKFNLEVLCQGATNYWNKLCAKHIQNSWLQLYKETPEYLKSVMQICPAHVRIQSCLNRPENLISILRRTPRMSDFNYVKASRDSEINYAKTSRITEFNYATWPDATGRRVHVFC